MTSKTPPPYAYPEKLLIEKMNSCKTIDDLVETGTFYKEMAEQNLITITQRMRLFCMVKQEQLIFKDKLK